MATYQETLNAAYQAGAVHCNDAQLMAWICANHLQTLCGALSPQLVWEGAQRKRLTTSDLTRLMATDVMAVSDLQWT